MYCQWCKPSPTLSVRHQSGGQYVNLAPPLSGAPISRSVMQTEAQPLGYHTGDFTMAAPVCETQDSILQSLNFMWGSCQGWLEISAALFPNLSPFNETSSSWIQYRKNILWPLLRSRTKFSILHTPREARLSRSLPGNHHLEWPML